ncbi:MAG: helix-turn-helix transcriptional regulator [Alphaproteobacteria bacterium]
MTEKAVLIERGQRLQNLRKKMGLTRAVFSELTGMSSNTLKSLELGSRTISTQKALLYSNVFNSLGVSLGENYYEASFEYLYHGKKPESPELPINDSDDKRIHDEMDFFIANPSYMLLEVQDDLMSPYYNPGDVVAGKKIINKKQFHLYQGCVCIIESASGEKLLRRIIKADNRKITAYILNHNHQSAGVAEEIVEAQYIAQAIRHWHLSELVVISQNPSNPATS